MADQPVAVSGGTGVGSLVDPNADAQRTADEAAAAAEKAKASAAAAKKAKNSGTPTPTSTSTVTVTPTPSSTATQEAVAKVTLSDEIHGQTANDYTCSKGRALNRQ